MIGEEGSGLVIVSLLSLLNDGGNGNNAFYMDEWDSCVRLVKIIHMQINTHIQLKYFEGYNKHCQVTHTLYSRVSLANQ